MRKIKNVLAILLGAAIMLGSSVMVGAKNDNFIFNLYTTQTSGVNIKEDTADAVVNTLSVSSTGNSVGYAVIGYNKTTGAKEYATAKMYYAGSGVLGKKYLSYFSGYAWVGASRYLEASKLYDSPNVNVSGRWAS